MDVHLIMRLLKTACFSVLVLALYGCGEHTENATSDNVLISDDGSTDDNESSDATDDNNSESDASNEDSNSETDDSSDDNNSETDDSSDSNNSETDDSSDDSSETDNSDDTDTNVTVVNLALNKQATQSSTAYGGNATRAVDGNIDGTYRNQSVSHTDSEPQAWWQVDLDTVEYIEYINIYNRTDSCCTSRLSDFYLFISETPFDSNDLAQTLTQANITSYHLAAEVDGSIKIDIELYGRYIRIQQVADESSINLAEVEVISLGEEPLPTAPDDPNDNNNPEQPTDNTDQEETDDSADPAAPVDTTPPDETEQETDPEQEQSQEQINYATGEVIYQVQCASCHLTLENSTKRDSSEAQIRSAVLTIPLMQNITLTDQEYQLLELVLNNDKPLDTVTEDESEQQSPSESLPAGQTLLARITNEEFVNSAMTLLSIETTESIESAKALMGAESDVLGLFNDASTQLVTQVALSGYINMIDTLLDVYFEGVTSDEAMRELYGCEDDLLNCGKVKANDIAEQAFRRTLSEQESTQINSLFDAVTQSYEEVDLQTEQFTTLSHQIRFRSAIYYILLSPDFLFLIETGTEDVDSNGEVYLSSQEIATRMAFFLTGNLPDETLLAEVEKDTLRDPEVRLAQANRLLASSSGEQQIANVLRAWLAIEDEVEESASAALDAFLLDWVANDKAFSDLYQAPIEVANIDGTSSVEPFGVLGLNAFVTSHTEYPTPSFIHRGLFVVERLLCEALPDDIPAEALESGELSEVEAFAVHSQDDCASCHRVFDNYGAAFQQFDPETSLFDVNNTLLGSSFDLYDIGDVVNEVSDLSDLSAEIASSQTAAACMAELWYRDALRRSINDKDSETLTQLIAEWQASQQMSVKSLLKAIISSDVFITLYL